MKYLNTPAEYKALGDSGTFSGYASIFGNIDLGGDIVERGAFKEVVTNGDGAVTALWQHDSRTPIGLAKVRQDDRGLAFEGQLVLEDPMARKALAHMKAGSVRGMSIGFDILPGGGGGHGIGRPAAQSAKALGSERGHLGYESTCGRDQRESAPDHDRARIRGFPSG